MSSKRNRPLSGANQSQNQASKNIVTARATISYSGPIPPAQELARYNEVLPGAAERILIMAETQSLHRQNLENRVISSEISNATRGQFFGFIIAVFGLFLVGFCAWVGEPILAGLVGVLDIGALVSAFLYGTDQRKKERLEKEQSINQKS